MHTSKRLSGYWTSNQRRAGWFIASLSFVINNGNRKFRHSIIADKIEIKLLVLDAVVMNESEDSAALDAKASQKQTDKTSNMS